MKNLLGITIFLLFAFNTHAQRTTIPGTNVSFELPLNWIAENADGQLFIMSAEEEGFILLSASQVNAGESIADLQHNKIEENGVVLNPSNYRLISQNRAAVNYTGDLFGLEIEGYAQMGIAASGDWAALALFFSEKGLLKERHKNAVEHIVKSLQFPTGTATAPTYNSANTNNTTSSGGFTPLHGAKLFYSSSDGNSATEKNINLCPNGSFTRTGYSNTSYGGMGYSEMDLRGYGQWEAIPLQGNAYQVNLYWADGKQGKFIIEPDGNAFFITNLNDWHVMTNSASCN